MLTSGPVTHNRIRAAISAMSKPLGQRVGLLKVERMAGARDDVEPPVGEPGEHRPPMLDVAGVELARSDQRGVSERLERARGIREGAGADALQAEREALGIAGAAPAENRRESRGGEAQERLELGRIVRAAVADRA